MNAGNFFEQGAPENPLPKTRTFEFSFKWIFIKKILWFCCVNRKPEIFLSNMTALVHFHIFRSLHSILHSNKILRERNNTLVFGKCTHHVFDGIHYLGWCRWRRRRDVIHQRKHLHSPGTSLSGPERGGKLLWKASRAHTIHNRNTSIHKNHSKSIENQEHKR